MDVGYYRRPALRMSPSQIPCVSTEQSCHGLRVERGVKDSEYPRNHTSIPGPFLGCSVNGNSVEIRVASLGGTIWRVVRNQDSLIGQAYSTFDIVPGEHRFGPATGRRFKC